MGGFFSSNLQNQEKNEKLANWLVVLAVSAITIIYIVLRVNIVHIPLDRDEGLYSYIGQLILDGKLPYRDGLEHKPPILFCLYAIGLLFFSPTDAGMHTFLHVYNFLTLICVFFIVKIYFESISAALWASLVYAVFSVNPEHQGFTISAELLALLPISLSLLLAIIAVKKDSFSLLFLSGVTASSALWIKQQTAPSIFFISLFIIISIISKAQTKDKAFFKTIKYLSFWGSGGILVSVLIAGYFYYKGIFSEFIYWSFTHNTLYVSDTIYINKIIERTTDIFRNDFLAIIVGLIIAIKDMVKKKAEGFFIVGLLIFSFLGAVPGYAFRHYFSLLALGVAIAGGHGFASLFNLIENKTSRITISLLSALLVVIIPIQAYPVYFFDSSSASLISRQYFGLDNPFPEAKKVAEYIHDHTNPEDLIYVFGSEPEITFLSQRRSCTSSLMTYPMVTSRYPRYKEFQETTWNQIKTKKPKYIIALYWFSPVGWDGIADLDILKQLQDLINKEYKLEAVMLVQDIEGKMVFAKDYTKFPTSEIEQNPENIYIYRIKEQTNEKK